MIANEEFEAMLSLKAQNTEQKDRIKELKAALRTAEKEAENLKSHIEKVPHKRPTSL